jgi:hypothetical protein
MEKWIYSGDVNWVDYGGKWIRKVSPGTFQIIEFMNMDEACGRDNEGQSKYSVELDLVDLNAIGPKEVASALSYIGAEGEKWESDSIREITTAEALHSYGCKAPIEQWNGNNARKLLREARSMAHSLARAASALAERMDRPVNAIGSTAAEYMRGDINAAISRGVASADPRALLIAKMQDAATIPCVECKGLGAVLYGDETCPVCQGRGKVVNTIGGPTPAR